MQSDSSPKRLDRTWHLWVFLLLCILGTTLRFYRLGGCDFWYDESCTFIYVQHLFDWPYDSSLLVESTNLPYYVLLRGWAALFGHSEAAYRSMSAAAASLVIPALGFFAYRLYGKAAGVVCTALVAFHPLHVYYAHEARAYALWTLILSVMLWLLYEASTRLAPRWWIAYGAVLFGCLHLHYFTLYWMASSPVCVFLSPERRRVFRQWLVTHTVVSLAFVPYFLMAVWPAGRGGGSAWVAEGWSGVSSMALSLWAFLPSGAYPGHLRGLSLLSPDQAVAQPAWLGVFARIVVIVVVATLALILLRYRRSSCSSKAVGETWVSYNGSAWALHGFVGGMAILPLLLASTYSLVIRPNYLVARYDLVAWPAFVLWLAIIIKQASHQAGCRVSARTITIACGLLLGCSLVPLQRVVAMQSAHARHSPDHVRADKLAADARPNSLVVVFSYDREYLLYYLYRAGFGGELRSFPSWLDGQIGWVDTPSDLDCLRVGMLQADAESMVTVIKSKLAEGDGVWIVYDSLKFRANDPRAEINQILMDEIRAAGLNISTVDEELGIGSILSD